MKKFLWLDEEESVVGSRSDPDDKIATDLGSKSTTENRLLLGLLLLKEPWEPCSLFDMGPYIFTRLYHICLIIMLG